MKNLQAQNGLDEQQTKMKLMKAAITLFAEKGYASASVREIVELAGVTKPSLYYYFSNKEGLFLAILNWAADWQEVVLADIMKSPGAVLERFIKLSQRLREAAERESELFKMIHNLVLGPPQGAPVYDYTRFYVRLVEAIKHIYLEGLAKQEVRKEDPDQVAILVLSVIDYCFHLDQTSIWIAPDDLAERLLSMAFHGLKPRKEE